MIIGILSDTHNKISGIDKAFDVFKSNNIKTIIHTGDWTTIETYLYISKKLKELEAVCYSVIGNNDKKLESYISEILNKNEENIIFPRNDKFLEIEFERKQIAVYHGHYKTLLHSIINSQKYDFVITGHTHKTKILKIENTIILNPGSTAFTIPRSKSNKSIMLLDTSNNEVKVINI